jgi:hypothetical protein
MKYLKLIFAGFVTYTVAHLLISAVSFAHTIAH